MSFVRRFTSWFDGRRRFVLGAFTAWTLVTASAAGAAPGDTGWVGVPNLSWVLVVLFVLLAIPGLALYIFLLKGDRPDREAVQRRPPSYWVVALVFLALFVLLRALSDDADETDEAEPAPSGVEVLQPGAGGVDPVGGAASTPVGRSEIVVAASVTAMATAALWWMRRTSPVVAEPAAGSDVSLAPAIDRAIADLDLGDEPRRAVLRAYASLEGALAERGLPRHANETAAEHLGRTLGSFPVDRDELVELGRLYERARFSSHSTPAAARDRARTILDHARADIVRSAGQAFEARS